MDVVIVDTGTANLASIRAAMTRIGCESRIERDADAIDVAELLVLPGVGSFGSGVQRLDELGIADSLRSRIAADRPLLAVCLGLQLLCRTSEESPGVQGLGVLETDVARFREADIVPQLGWNNVDKGTCELLEDGYAYYANSYRVDAAPEGWGAAMTTHGERFVAAVERGRVLACQFHPELSGPWGHALLRRWIERSPSC